MWSQQNSAVASQGLFPAWLRTTIGPLLLIALTLPFASLLVSASTTHGGSLLALLRALLAQPLPTLQAALLAPTPTTLGVLAAFCAWQLALMRLVPGRRYSGPPTATGHVPHYTDNGLACFALTVGAYLGLSSWGLGARLLPPALHYSPAILCVEYARMVSFLSLAALGLCAALAVKGRTCPSGRDAGSTGNAVQDLYWGTELYPRVLGWDVKQFTNCRFGMMMWGLLPLAFAAQGMEASGAALPSLAVAVNTALQLVYVAKFFLWESGYMSSLDIMHDRAGYMICWGCMVWCVCEGAPWRLALARSSPHAQPVAPPMCASLTLRNRHPHPPPPLHPLPQGPLRLRLAQLLLGHCGAAAAAAGGRGPLACRGPGPPPGRPGGHLHQLGSRCAARARARGAPARPGVGRAAPRHPGALQQRQGQQDLHTAGQWLVGRGQALSLRARGAGQRGLVRASCASGRRQPAAALFLLRLLDSAAAGQGIQG